MNKGFCMIESKGKLYFNCNLSVCPDVFDKYALGFILVTVLEEHMQSSKDKSEFDNLLSFIEDKQGFREVVTCTLFENSSEVCTECLFVDESKLNKVNRVSKFGSQPNPVVHVGLQLDLINISKDTDLVRILYKFLTEVATFSKLILNKDICIDSIDLFITSAKTNLISFVFNDVGFSKKKFIISSLTLKNCSVAYLKLNAPIDCLVFEDSKCMVVTEDIYVLPTEMEYNEDYTMGIFLENKPEKLKNDLISHCMGIIVRDLKAYFTEDEHSAPIFTAHCLGKLGVTYNLHKHFKTKILLKGDSDILSYSYVYNKARCFESNKSGDIHLDPVQLCIQDVIEYKETDFHSVIFVAECKLPRDFHELYVSSTIPSYNGLDCLRTVSLKSLYNN